MYNRLLSYVSQEKIIFQIHESFGNNLYTLGVFINLSKAFVTGNHSIILKKLEIYGIHENFLNGLKVI